MPNSMFEPDEWNSADILNQKKLSDKLLTLNEVVRMIARLGGFLARKGNAEPDVKTISWVCSVFLTSQLELDSQENFRLRSLVYNQTPLNPL